MKAQFITLEGIEGVGKTTAAKFLFEEIAKKTEVILTREPGGTPIAEAIRHVLLNSHSEEMLPETELLLLFASRAQHVNTVIRPALAAGKWVLCDRFTDASFAYQGYGRGLDINKIEILADFTLHGFQPDLTILLDMPVNLAMKRLDQRKSLDRIEKEQHEFFEKIREGYLHQAKLNPGRFYIIDANKPLVEVKQHLLHALNALL